MTTKLSHYYFVNLAFFWYRPEVIGWGYTDGDPNTQVGSSFFEKGGASATQYQQSLAVPVLSAEEVN